MLEPQQPLPEPPPAPKPRKTSARSIAASRANGAKSKGPATEAGSQISSKNSLKHGLLAATLVLDSESDARFCQFLDSLLAEHRPITATENALVESMAAARWRQMRTWSLQKTGFDLEIERQDPGSAPRRATIAFHNMCDSGRTLDVAVIAWVRPEFKFDIIADLIHRMDEDCRIAHIALKRAGDAFPPLGVVAPQSP